MLKGVTIDVRTNQIVALVGASGCGKSSIISLLERFYDPVEGKLLFNGIDLKDVDNAWYHQTQVAIVQQEPILFSGSIRSNILYGIDFGDFPEQTITERYAVILRLGKIGHCLDQLKLVLLWTSASFLKLINLVILCHSNKYG